MADEKTTGEAGVTEAGQIPGLKLDLKKQKQDPSFHKMVEYLARKHRGTVGIIPPAFGVDDYGAVEKWAAEFRVSPRLSHYISPETGETDKTRLKEMTIALRLAPVVSEKVVDKLPNSFDMAAQADVTMLLACLTKINVTERGPYADMLELLQPILAVKEDVPGKKEVRIAGAKRYLTTREQAYWIERDAREAVASRPEFKWSRLYPDKQEGIKRKIAADGKATYVTREGAEVRYQECYPDCHIGVFLQADIAVDPAHESYAAYDSKTGVFIVGKKTIEAKAEITQWIAFRHEMNHGIWEAIDPKYKADVLSRFSANTPGLQQFVEALYKSRGHKAQLEWMTEHNPGEETLQFVINFEGKNTTVNIHKDNLINELLAFATWTEVTDELGMLQLGEPGAIERCKAARRCLAQLPPSTDELLKKRQLSSGFGKQMVNELQAYVAEVLKRHKKRFPEKETK